jgi:multiple sugar transport system substrate-binding protein
MKMKFNLMALILATLLLGMAVISGCSTEKSEETANPSATPETATPETATPETPETLTLWMPPFAADGVDQKYWEDTLKPFEEANNVSVTVEITPWDGYEEKYLTAALSGSGPDVGYMYMEMIADFIDKGSVADISPYITDADKENFLYEDSCYFKGQFYCLPIVFGNPRVLYVNTDILAKSGYTEPPTTWNEFIEYGQKIAKDSPNIYPFLQDWGNPAWGAMNNVFSPYLYQAGGSYFDDDGNLALNDGSALKAAQFLYDLKYKYKILPDSTTSMKESDITAAFLEGKVAMIVAGTTYAGKFDEANIKWDFVTSLKDETGGTFTATDSLVIMNASKNKDLAYKLVQYMLSGEMMAKFHKEIIMFPPIGKDEVYADNPKFESIYAEDSAFLKSFRPRVGSFQVMDNLYKNLQLMMINELTPEQAINQTVEYSNNTLE